MGKQNDKGKSTKVFIAGTKILDQASKQAKGRETVKQLIERLGERGDFPALSEHVEELNRIALLATTTATELSNVILQDPGLTSKIIRLVNSPFYSWSRGPITTVSRAIVLMGFDEVRQAAMSLLLFERFQEEADEKAHQLRETILSSMMSGHVAKTIASEQTGVNSEEAVICAMFHNLGKQVLGYYFPEEMKKVKRLISDQHLTEDAAIEEVLGLSIDELCQELGKQWNLPQRILDTMTALPKEHKLPKPKSSTQKLRLIAGFSQEVAELTSTDDPEDAAEQLSSVAERYQKSINLKTGQLDDLRGELSSLIKNYSETAHIDSSKSGVVRNTLQGISTTTIADLSKDRGAPKSSVTKSLIQAVEYVSQPHQPLTQEDVKRVCEAEQEIAAADRDTPSEELLARGGREIAEELKMGEFDLSELMILALETMYSGLKLAHAIFCLHDVKTRTMRARLGLGYRVESLIPKFKFPMTKGRNLFAQAMFNGESIIVENIEDHRSTFAIPAWYCRFLNAPMFLLYPITMRGFPVALLYGDFAEPNIELTNEVRAQLNSLKDLATQAILRLESSWGG
ncbi:MAG: HDOD domain-containing protein [Proteobacteria bacterium]|nr:HDOD domain-containing protein [Pseudomonadota bacterium]